MIDTFVNQLQKANPKPSVANPWRGTTQKAQICRNNVANYFRYFLKHKPSVLLVGEALGYKGGLHTGIPFSSQALLDERKTEVLFEKIENYNSKGISEATASIAWELFDYSGHIPLCWNIFPFHPHKKFKPSTNRAPNARELRYGLRFLVELIKIYHPIQIVGVGNKAAETLVKAGIIHQKIRHPSYGGKQDFKRQYLKIIKDL